MCLVQEIQQQLNMCMRKLVTNLAKRRKINLQIVELHFARGLCGMEDTKKCRKALNPGEWWEMFVDGTPELKRFSIRILSFTCN